MYKYIIALGLLLLASACGTAPDRVIGVAMEEGVSDNVTDSSEVIYVTDAIGKPTKTMQDIIESVRLVKLETAEEALVGFGCDIIVSSQNIFIKNPNRTVLIFDRNGKFVRKIGRGQGADEVAFCRCLFFDEKAQTLFVNDGAQFKILKFNAEGEHISNIYYEGLGIEDFVVDGNKVYFVRTGSPFGDNILKVCVADSLFNVQDTFCIGKTDFRQNLRYYLNPTDDGININKVKNKNVYCFKDGGVCRKYVLNNDLPDVEFKTSNKAKTLQELQEEQRSMYSGLDNVYTGNLLESHDFMYMCFVGCADLKAINVFKNKKTGEVFSTGLLRGSFANYLRPEVVVDYKNNMFANVLYLEYFYGSEEFPDYIWNGNNLNGLISDDDMEILKSSKPDDNPIIVLFKLKSNI